MTEPQRVLAVVTSNGTYEDGDKTGLWLSELTHFHDAFTKAGYVVDVASPKGGSVPLDPVSMRFPAYDASARTFRNDPVRMGLIEHSLPLSEVGGKDYALIFFAGGHGTMGDFKDDTDIARLIDEVHAADGVVSAVCHGVAALLNTPSLLKGCALTGFSDLEERLIGKGKKVPYLLESALRKQGAAYSRGWVPFTPYAVADGRVVTGQNPQSTKAMASLALSVLSKGPRPMRGNAKCLPCLFGTWTVGLSAVAWGVQGFLGTGNLLTDILLLVVGGIGLWFLVFQYPFRPCSRCVAAAHTGA